MNPGNLDSDLYRTMDSQTGFDWISTLIFTKTMLYPQVYGAYTELFSGLSPEVTLEKTGSWSEFSHPHAWHLLLLTGLTSRVVGPWGRFFDIRHDLVKGTERGPEGEQSVSEKFWDWSVEQTEAYC